MLSMENRMNQSEKYLDTQLWHACAGGMAQTPPLNSNVYYFPQGHAEHAARNADFRNFPRISPLVLCRVLSIKYLADAESDEVYAKIGLVPLRGRECDDGDECGLMGFDVNEGKGKEKEKAISFAKTLTQSDANNGGGFSVPRYCAETIFPTLDHTAEPPVQTILAKDVQGEVWRFRHIYRGTPRRHLLTTGWSNFVNQKKLVAGDSIVFLRAENGDLRVGIRRAKVGLSSGWAANGGKEGESVVEAARFAANGQPFEVVYYPRASTPEFVVRASTVRAAMRVQWCPGMRFKMAFETEDSSRISWFMGTVSSLQVVDPIHWPNSPWRLLQVAWHEPDLLQNVKHVNPWLVELVSDIPPILVCPSSKRPRFTRPLEFPPGQFSMSMLLSNPLSPSSPLCCSPDIISAGIQGARHDHFLLSSSDGLRPFNFKPLDRKPNGEDNGAKTRTFVLFGQPILTEQQISQSNSMDEEFPRLKDIVMMDSYSDCHGNE